jgi:NADH dehydrogenase
VHISDVARIAVEQGALNENVVLDVAGPEKFSYYDYVKLISQSMGLRRAIIPVPPIVAWVVGKVVGIIVSDRVITRAEIRGLMNGLMASDDKPLGVVKFSEWIQENGTKLGLKYQNDMKERKYKTASLFYNSPNSTK